MNGPYDQAFSQSIKDPEGFWGKEAEQIHWYKKWDKVLDDSNKPFYRWFKGGVVNTCYNAVDRHVEAGHGDRVAVIYDSPVTSTIRKYTYSDLRDHVARFAGVLRKQGVGKGDRVIVYMPMVPEALIAMLACARIGAVHSVVFGGFASNELAVRINDAKPKVIVTASCGIEVNRVIPYKPLLDGAIALSDSKPSSTIILQRPQSKAELKPGFDLDWEAEMATATPAECVPVEATDPLYILYTSGTTGQPKGVVRDNGGHLVALKWTMKNIYDIEPGEVFWAASDVGWVVGHSYIVYAPLINGSTSVFYEGKPVGTPDAGA
ncbi:MAG TPA: AMP-binding protein, partial [Candidatus Defluviicoccus seviourii]|nr:AMP-binding protein [Candidatus Defluviicoccus seviourii]